MIFLIPMWVGIFIGLCKWLGIIVTTMANRCRDRGYKFGAIVSNICYVVFPAFLALVATNITVFLIAYPILAWLGNTVFCLCTTNVPEHIKHDDADDDYGYIGH